MRYLFLLLTGLGIVLGAGVIHGMWTHRWQPSQELEDAAARLPELPGDLQHWRAVERITLSDDTVKAAGARAARVCRYVHEGNGDTLWVSLLIGESGKMAVHRPEHCYTASGFELAGGTVPFHLDMPDGRRAEFRTSRFIHQEPSGKQELRVFWSWKSGNEWSAPESPRWSLRDRVYVYKLYVICEKSRRTEKMEQEAGYQFLHLLLPRLNESLADR
jgi:hypothetical protein